MSGDVTPDGPILFAYDGSDQAKAAIQEAARQLTPGRDAVVLTVWEPLAALPLRGIGGMAPAVDESMESEARRTAGEGAQLAREAGFETTTEAVSGTPIWRSIVDAAGDHNASIVVMGSHGRTGLGFVLMGSVAAAVARHDTHPILIVHATPEPEDRTS
jgi:nucleotide-binding universal stress UspA family protein